VAGSREQAPVSVALANWNGAPHVARCLDAVFDQSSPPTEVVVVDNGSTDGSAETIARAYPQVRLIRRPENEGFCRGFNRAIRATSCPFVLILNTDVFLDRDFLLCAVRAIEAGPDIGWVAARVLKDDGRGVDYVGRFLRRRLSLVNSANQTEPEEVFAGSGAAVFCRREALDDVAYRGEFYDETFFAYVEDLDLAWRMQLRNWRCVFAPDVVATHLGSATMEGRIRVLDKPAFFQRHILPVPVSGARRTRHLGIFPAPASTQPPPSPRGDRAGVRSPAGDASQAPRDTATTQDAGSEDSQPRSRILRTRWLTHAKRKS